MVCILFDMITVFLGYQHQHAPLSLSSRTHYRYLPYVEYCLCRHSACRKLKYKYLYLRDYTCLLPYHDKLYVLCGGV